MNNIYNLKGVRRSTYVLLRSLSLPVDENRRDHKLSLFFLGHVSMLQVASHECKNNNKWNAMQNESRYARDRRYILIICWARVIDKAYANARIIISELQFMKTKVEIQLLIKRLFRWARVRCPSVHVERPSMYNDTVGFFEKTWNPCKCGFPRQCAYSLLSL